MFYSVFFLIPLFLQGQACDDSRVLYPDSGIFNQVVPGAGQGTINFFDFGIFVNEQQFVSNACNGSSEQAIEIRITDDGIPSVFSPYNLTVCVNHTALNAQPFVLDPAVTLISETSCGTQTTSSSNQTIQVCFSISISSIGQCGSLYLKPDENIIGGALTGIDGFPPILEVAFFPPNIVDDCGFTGAVSSFLVSRPKFRYTPVSTGNISSSVNPNLTLFVPDNQTLTIDQNYFFDHDFILGSNAKVVVNSGVEFSKVPSATASVIKGCTNLWESIEVEDGGAVSFNGITVTDGHLGINLLGSATLSLDDVRFEDNVFGISSFGYPLGTIQTSVFSNNTFVGTGTIKPHFTLPTPTDRPVAGISLSHSGFKNFSAPSLSASNRFENISTGFISYSGTTITAQNTYIDCDRAISLNGDGTTGVAAASSNQITNCDEGVHLSRITSVAANNNISGSKTGINVDVLGPLSMQIRDNTITGASVRGIRSVFNQSGIMTDNTLRVSGNVQSTVGIDLLLSNNLSIAESNITTDLATSGIHAHLLSGNNTLAENTVNINQPSIGTNGIYLENSNLNMITCNLVQSSATTFTESFGILNENSDNNTFSCNGLSDVEVGINHVGMMQSVAHTGNQYGDGRVGLMLGRQQSPNTTIGVQQHRGDNWLGTFASAAALHWSQNNNFSLQSQFTTDEADEGPNDNFYLDPTERIGPSNWFVNDSGTTPVCGQGTSPACANGAAGNNFTDPNGAIDFVDAVLSADTVLTDNEEWVLINETYYWILTQIPPSSWDTQITDFMDEYADEPQGEFAEIQALLDEATAENIAIATLTNNSASELSDYVATGNTIHLNNIQNNDAQLIPLVAAYESTKGQKLSSALGILQGISPINNIESDYAIIYTAVISFIGNPTATINASLLAPLTDRCPTEYPRSVAMSRALLHLDTPQSYDTWDNCGQGTNPRSLTSSQPSSLLYPNPTDGLLHFDQEVSDIEVRDLTGRLVVKSQGAQQTIDLTEFKDGIYVILYTTDGQLVSKKVVKQQ